MSDLEDDESADLTLQSGMSAVSFVYRNGIAAVPEPASVLMFATVAGRCGIRRYL